MIVVNKYLNEPTLNLSDAYNDMHKSLRKASYTHKMSRKYIQDIMVDNYYKNKSEITLIDICNHIEDRIIALTQNKNSIAFPTGLNLNNVIAHDTVNIDDKRVFQFKKDVIKIDIGVHNNGFIIDSAFTLTFNPDLKNLLMATKEATNEAIKMAGIDAVCNDISKVISEIIESYEIELDKKVYPIKAVKEIGGHSIDQWNIHSGKLLLNGVCNYDIYKKMRMNENEVWAIETFCSTGTGTFKLGEPNNHLMIEPKYNIDTLKPSNFKFKTSLPLLNWIYNKRKTLPFTQRWLIEYNNYNIGLFELVQKKIVNTYKPMYDIPNSYSSQFEHTIYIHQKGVEVLSLGEDY